MKKLIIIFIFLMFAPLCVAHSVEVTLSGKYLLPNSENIQPLKGVELEVEHGSFLLWLSYDQTMMRLVGQELADFEIFGFGLGYKRNLFKGFSVAIKAGYYHPQKSYRVSYQEAIIRDMNNRNENTEGWAIGSDGHLGQNNDEPHYILNTCQYEINGNFGATLQADWNVSIRKNIALDLFGGYRMLKFGDRVSANIAGLGPEHGLNPYHEFYTNRDWSGAFFGLRLTFRW